MKRRTILQGEVAPDGGIPVHDFGRLVALRFVVITVELLVIALARGPLGMDLPIQPILAIVAVQLVGNLFFRHQARHTAGTLSPHRFVGTLVVDVLSLTALLYLAGGARNPFVSLLLAPLVIAATVLPPRLVWGMAVLCLSAYGLLLSASRPMPRVAGGRDFDWHVLGMGVGFVLVVLLIVFVVLRLAESLRRRERALAEAREAALRDERLVALGTLAAGAAHELGTPLSTMAVISQDLIDEPGQDEALVRRLSILRDQVDRCKSILAMIAASAGRPRADEGGGLPVDRFVEGVIGQWRGRLPEARLDVVIEGDVPAPRIVVDEGLRQAIVSLLDNAAGFSDGGRIEFAAHWDGQTLSVEVADRGRGIAGEIREALGRRPLTTRDDGHGLGLFMGHAVIERLGGTLTFRDRDGGGTVARIELPLARLRVGD